MTTLIPMPEGFHWKPRCHLDKEPTGLFLGNLPVASMLERLDGTWFARLHLREGLGAPVVTRSCTSFDAGRRGCELWAMRHLEELQVLSLEKDAWIRKYVCLNPPGGRRMDLERLDERAARAMAAHAMAENRSAIHNGPLPQ